MLAAGGPGRGRGADNRLAYIDQGSFLALRGLGHQYRIQFLWIYERHVDFEGLRRFQRNLGEGLLGRRIERSPLPFGRHRWVSCASPDELDIASVARPVDEVMEWADERMRMPMDPEHGPAWHLGVQPLTTGGAAVSLLSSHTTTDGLALCLSVAEAARGDRRDLNYPPPRARSRAQAIVEDFLDFGRSIPDFGRAVTAGARTAKATKGDRAHKIRGKSRPPVSRDRSEISAPTAAAWFDVDLWDRRAKELGGTSNSLFAGVASRYAMHMGRIGAQGQVFLSWPVSNRKPGDTRGNALTGVVMPADPEGITASLAAVRADMRTALAAGAELTDDMLAALALSQLTPKLLIRRLETVMADLMTVGCSNLGDLDPMVNRPDGSDADRVLVRSIEPQITRATLDRTQGYAGVLSGRVNGKVFVVVGGWIPGTANSKAQFVELLRRSVEDMGLNGDIY